MDLLDSLVEIKAITLIDHVSVTHALQMLFFRIVIFSKTGNHICLMENE